MVRLPETIVSLQHVDKWFGNNHVVKDMNLEIYKGEFLTHHDLAYDCGV